MNVVSNASPLINLACIDKLDLLPQLYGELFIPEAVWNEVVVEGIGLICAVKPQLDALRNIAGFHINAALYERVLQDVGEE